MKKAENIRLLSEAEKDVLIYYKNDAFETPEIMRFRKMVRKVIEQNRKD